MANMVMTVLEAHIPAERWGEIEQGFASLNGNQPSALVKSYLVQGSADPTLWRLVGIWHSLAALDEYRNSVGTAGGVQLMRSLGAEPTMTLLEIRGQ